MDRILDSVPSRTYPCATVKKVECQIVRQSTGGSHFWDMAQMRAGRAVYGGTGFYFGRLALNEMSVEYMVSLPLPLRLPWNAARKGACQPGSPPRAANSACCCSPPFFGIPIQFLIQFHGLALTTVSHASLMVGSMPVLLGVAAAIFAGERLDAIGWGALVASTVGAALIVLGGHRPPVRMEDLPLKAISWWSPPFALRSPGSFSARS